MDRERLNLNGNWKFMVSSAERLSATTMLDMESIRVPSCWETELPGLVAGAQMAWYQRTLTVPARWIEHAVILHFGAVNYFCKVFLNGRQVGEHEGGYTPFSFRVEKFLQAGENLLEVAVTNPAAAMARFPYEVAPAQANGSEARLSLEEIPYGKQSWYGSGSGIWQGVWIESRETCHIQSIRVTPDVDQSQAHLQVRLSEGGSPGTHLVIQITQLDPGPASPPQAAAIDTAAAASAHPSTGTAPGSQPAGLEPNGTGGTPTAPDAPAPVRKAAAGKKGSTTAKPAAGEEAGASTGTAASSGPESAPGDMPDPAAPAVPAAPAAPTRQRFTWDLRLTRNEHDYVMTIPMPDARLWSPESPVRYRVMAHLMHGHERLDTETTVFGMRKIESRDGSFFLNNREIYIIGALDQDFYPGTLYVPPSEEFLEDQFQKAREMGLNLLRCHIKVPDPRYLQIADRLGILVWYEIPNWWTLTEKAMERAQTTIEAMIDRDFNHPSVIIWTIVNEDWGTNLRYSPLDRQWVKWMYHHVKRLDPTRLVVDNSACVGNLHVETDIEDFHVYYSIPDHYDYWKGWVRDFANRARWTYTQEGDAVRTFKEPLMVSEFGNWGLPSIRGLRETYGTDPSWMITGQSVAYPYGTERRYAQYKLDAIFGAYDEFAVETQWHQFRSMKFEIEEMRRYRSIVGYVITEFTDIHWECNGLLDMVRRRKAFHTALPQINSPDMVMLDWTRVNYWSGEEIRMPIQVSHYGWAGLQDGRLRWSLDDQNGVKNGVSLSPGTVAGLGELTTTAPNVLHAERQEIALTLENGDGSVLHQNAQEIFVFPAHLSKAPNPRRIWVHDPRDVWNLRASMNGAGYQVVGHPGDDVECAVVTRFDDDVRRWSREGGIVLCLAKPQTLKGRNGALHEVGADLFENGSIVLTARERRPGEKISGKPWDGDWATNFNWIKFSEVCPNLVRQNPLGFQFLRIVPDYVILGYEAEDDFADIYSGMVVGWVHSPVAMMAGARYGRGRVLVCTFKLEEAYGSDPTATVMMHDLIEFVTSDRFRPSKEAAGNVRMTAFMKAITEGE